MSPATIPLAFAAAASRASLLSLSSSSCVFFFAGSADAGAGADGGGTISGTISGTASTRPASSPTVPVGASLEAFGSARTDGTTPIALESPAPEPSPRGLGTCRRGCCRSPPAPSPSSLAFSANCALVSSSRSLAFSSAGAAAESTLLSASVSLASALAAAWASHDMPAARDSGAL